MQFERHLGRVGGEIERIAVGLRPENTLASAWMRPRIMRMLLGNMRKQRVLFISVLQCRL
jgi:hypothetical protein